MSDAEHIGPYELRGELGRGAMARVWRAWDPKLEREVAIKEPLFDSRLSDDVIEEMIRRFIQEGRTAAKLQHNGIVAIYAADVYDGRPAIVMELVKGATLGELLEKGPLGGEPTLDALNQLLDAVGYAHKNGVIHRDIKPDNIFVNEFGHIKLSDFGIARTDDSSSTRATMVGAVLGTPGYMSPEQAKGAEVDKRSDLFSIGVVGYEMLTGKNPFGAGDGSDSTTLIYRIVHESAPEIDPELEADLSSDIRPAIMAALSKDPDNRPQTAEDFKTMLKEGASAQIRKEDSALLNIERRKGSSANGRPKWLPYVLVGAACVVALSIFIGILSTSGPGPNPSPAPPNPSTYPVYIGPSDGKVAIYTNASTQPFEVSDVPISVLAQSDQDAINAHIGFASVEEAQASIQELIDALPPEPEPEPEPDPTNTTATLTVTGEDGTTRTATIRLDQNSGRVIADSNDRALSYSEISNLTDAELCIAWNEIIAAETGYKFKNSGLANYFNSRKWYSPSSSGASSVGGVAGKNVSLLQSALSDGWWEHLATY